MSRRELGVVLLAEDADDVFHPLLGRFLGQHVEHLGLDVHGVGFARRADGFGDGQGVVAIATAHVADIEPRAQAEVLAHLHGGLLAIALVPDEPARAHPVHGLGDGAAHVGRGSCLGLRLLRVAECGAEQQHKCERGREKTRCHGQRHSSLSGFWNRGVRGKTRMPTMAAVF
jgi:hypothetical protein